MIITKFNKKTGILMVTYLGDIFLDDLIDFGDKIYTDSSLPRKLLILTDVTKGQYKIELSKFPELIENLKRHVSVFEYIKVAFIQTKPKETAYSMLMSSKNRIRNYYHAVFSTREAAIEWLTSS